MSGKRNSSSPEISLKLPTSRSSPVEEFSSDVNGFVPSMLSLLESLPCSCFDSKLQELLAELQLREFESLSFVTTWHSSACKLLSLAEVSGFWSAVDSFSSSDIVFSTIAREATSSLFAEVLSLAHSALLSRSAAVWNSSCYKRETKLTIT